MARLTQKEFEWTRDLLNNPNRDSYDAPVKAEFARIRKKYLKHLATLLGLTPGSYDLRYNAGGIAVFGEVTLHTDSLYIQMSDSFCGPIMYRTVKSRKDYSGGANQWAGIEKLKHIEQFSENLQGFLERQAS